MVSETCPLLEISPDGQNGRQEREGEFLDPLPRCCLGLTVQLSDMYLSYPAPDLLSVLEVVEGAGLVAGLAGGARLVAVLDVDAGGARLVAALAREEGGELVTILDAAWCWAALALSFRTLLADSL